MADFIFTMAGFDLLDAGSAPVALAAAPSRRKTRHLGWPMDMLNGLPLGQAMSRIAIFCDYYLPGFKAGGPIVSTSRLISGSRRNDFRVVTGDRELGDSVPFPGYVRRRWEGSGRVRIAYQAPGPRDRLWAWSELRKWRPEIVYLNSLHSPRSSLLPLAAMRIGLMPHSAVLIAPRGGTLAGALGSKRRKKQLARPFIKWLVGGNVTWHVSSSLEEAGVRSWWGTHLPEGHQVLIQSDPGPVPQDRPSSGCVGGLPIVVFASRIHPSKGLDEAIRLLGLVTAPFRFLVFGPIQDLAYWAGCQAAAEHLLPEGSMEYMGTYAPAESLGIFGKATVFLFPTRGENFGHVVAEALSVGCPVAVAPTTPWTQSIDAGGGHVLRGTDEALQYLEGLLRASLEDAMLARARSWIAYREWFDSDRNHQDIFDRVVKR